MRNKERLSRKKVVWAYSIVLKYLKWYIQTSEVIPSTEKGPLLHSLADVHRQLVKADRVEDRHRSEDTGRLESWLNNRREEVGKKPWRGRRFVDELISAILEK
jgi:hypothetical protein